jgi:hypothetical protein
MCGAGKRADVKRKEAEGRRAAAQRKVKAMRALGLGPPRDSPFAARPCLDVARRWLVTARLLTAAWMSLHG